MVQSFREWRCSGNTNFRWIVWHIEQQIGREINAIQRKVLKPSILETNDLRKSIKPKTDKKNIQMSFWGKCFLNWKIEKLKLADVTRLKTQTNWMLTESKERRDNLIELTWCWEYVSVCLSLKQTRFLNTEYNFFACFCWVWFI